MFDQEKKKADKTMYRLDAIGITSPKSVTDWRTDKINNRVAILNHMKFFETFINWTNQNGLTILVYNNMVIIFIIP